MGIPKLNKWLVEHCSSTSIKNCSLAEFQDKTVVVDISIYLYRFLMDGGQYHENLYLFFSLFRYYCIRPIFIFDGKAPPEKKATMQKRKLDKQEASTEYSEMEILLENTEDENRRIELLRKMAVLKKRMLKISWKHIDDAIDLLTAFGFEYYLAPNEADQLCIHLAVTNQAHAIVSDDMDMLISGATLIIRNLNLYTHQITLYDTNRILSDIGMTLKDFRETVVLAGTDYDNHTSTPIKQCFELFYEWSVADSSFEFDEWLEQKGVIVLSDFRHTCSLFDTSEMANELEKYIQEKRVSTPFFNIPEIKRIMSIYNFVFVP